MEVHPMVLTKEGNSEQINRMIKSKGEDVAQHTGELQASGHWQMQSGLASCLNTRVKHGMG